MEAAIPPLKPIRLKELPNAVEVNPIAEVSKRLSIIFIEEKGSLTDPGASTSASRLTVFRGRLYGLDEDLLFWAARVKGRIRKKRKDKKILFNLISRFQ